MGGENGYLETGSERSSSSAGVRAFASTLAKSVVVAVVVATVDSQLKGAWAPWLHRLVPWLFAAILVYVLIGATKIVAPRLRTMVRRRRVESKIRQQVSAIAEAIIESMTQSHVKSAGNIFNQLHAANTLDARLVT